MADKIDDGGSAFAHMCGRTPQLLHGSQCLLQRLIHHHIGALIEGKGRSTTRQLIQAFGK